jgi:solute carrier family 35 protein E3
LPGLDPAQVLGHSKTILVLLGGWLFLGDIITARQAGGMALAVLGMVAYGVATSLCVCLNVEPASASGVHYIDELTVL